MNKSILIPVALVLLVIDYYIIKNTKKPPQLIEVEKRFEKLREYIRTNPNVPEKFKKLDRPIKITAWHRVKSVGYNVNKGSEIGLCIDGSPNDIMNVLLHELAHTVTVKYSHNENFWNHLKELTSVAVDAGVYQPITEVKDFCGKKIRD